MGVRTRWLPFELHPETPPEGAPKPFTDEQWPRIRQRLLALAETVGMPIDPPRRNVNSRAALEIGELVRERGGDAASAAFHHDVSRAFFTEQADISDLNVLVRHAARLDVPEDAVRAAWAERRYAGAVDASIRASRAAGVTGVPAYGWDGQPAVCGMMEPERIVQALGAS
jgi:predicted DsbA family dithiol-disulfide isomerase